MFLARLRNAAALLAAVSCASFGILASLAGQPPTPTGSAAQVSVAPEDDAEREAPAIQVDVEVVKCGPWTRIATLFGTVRAADWRSSTPGSRAIWKACGPTSAGA